MLITAPRVLKLGFKILLSHFLHLVCVERDGEIKRSCSFYQVSWCLVAIKLHHMHFYVDTNAHMLQVKKMLENLKKIVKTLELASLQGNSSNLKLSVSLSVSEDIRPGMYRKQDTPTSHPTKGCPPICSWRRKGQAVGEPPISSPLNHP